MTELREEGDTNSTMTSCLRAVPSDEPHSISIKLPTEEGGDAASPLRQAGEDGIRSVAEGRAAVLACRACWVRHVGCDLQRPCRRCVRARRKCVERTDEDADEALPATAATITEPTRRATKRGRAANPPSHEEGDDIEAHVRTQVTSILASLIAGVPALAGLQSPAFPVSTTSAAFASPAASSSMSASNPSVLSHTQSFSPAAGSPALHSHSQTSQGGGLFGGGDESAQQQGEALVHVRKLEMEIRQLEQQNEALNLNMLLMQDVMHLLISATEERSGSKRLGDMPILAVLRKACERCEQQFVMDMVLADDAPLAIFSCRSAAPAGGRIMYANDALANLTGYTRYELIGMSWDRLVVPEQRGHAQDRFIHLLLSRPGAECSQVVPTRLLTRCKNNHKIHLDVLVQMFYDKLDSLWAPMYCLSAFSVASNGVL